MATLARGHGTFTNPRGASWYDLLAGATLVEYYKLIGLVKVNYFGVIAMLIPFASALGAIAVMQIQERDAPLWQLGLCVCAAMANLVGIVGQASVKWVVNLFILSVAINAILLFLDLF